MTETNDVCEDQTLSRSSLYYFLSTLFLNPPGSDSIVKVGELVSAAKESMHLGDQATELLPILHAKDDEDTQNLIQEYHDLFKVPLEKYVAPYESVYRDKRMSGQAAAAVKKIYAQVGFAIPHEYYELADHIGIELAFMATLCREEITACRNNRFELVNALLGMENKFLEEHLVCWLPDLCDKIFEKTENAFYRAVAKITLEFVQCDINSVQALLDQT
jgi:TorA maturation chaperone TorD